MEALHTPFWVFVSSFTTSLIFIWLGRRRVERIMRELRIQKIRDKNRELRCERAYFDTFSAENEKYIFLGRILFLARKKFFSRKGIALALGCSESKINSLCVKYDVRTSGYAMSQSKSMWIQNQLATRSFWEKSGKIANEHE